MTFLVRNATFLFLPLGSKEELHIVLGNCNRISPINNCCSLIDRLRNERIVPSSRLLLYYENMLYPA